MGEGARGPARGVSRPLHPRKRQRPDTGVRFRLPKHHDSIAHGAAWSAPLPTPPSPSPGKLRGPVLSPLSSTPQPARGGHLVKAH